MKFKIDTRFIAIQTLKAIAGFIIGLLLVLVFLDIREPIDFAITSFAACIVVYFVNIFPRNIIVMGGIISFVEKYGLKRCNVKLSDIINVETSYKFYNTVMLTTRSGKKYRLHPKDTQTLKDTIFPGK